MFLSKTVFSWYIQGAFYPRLYIEGCDATPRNQAECEKNIFEVFAVLS